MAKICLMGLPGSGKSSLGKRLAARRNTKWIDVDEDIPESAWQCSVADKLSKVGDEQFLKKEEHAMEKAELLQEGVLSLSGSVPMGPRAMEKLWRNKWLIVWLDVDQEDILKRLASMKVDRIVGGNGGDLASVLKYRIQFYEKWYDLRVLGGRGWDLDQMEEELVETLERCTLTTVRWNLQWWNNKHTDQLVSTRDRTTRKIFSLGYAVLNGLAPDSGLFIPLDPLPRISISQLSRFVNTSYQYRAMLLLERLIISSVTAQGISDMVSEAYSSFSHPDIVPVRKLESNVYLAELFYGPTGSFKDLALQFTPHLVANFLPESQKSLVLVATSGDTGSAVLEGFGRMQDDNIAVLVLYPTDGISEVQRKQMVTCAARNVRVVAVKGDFDQCQRMVKQMLGMNQLRKELRQRFNVDFNTGNSINWGRILPQLVYHFHAYLQLVAMGVIKLGDEVDLVVPSGNFGNMLSGLLARYMGAPYGRMIVASNTNNILSDFINTGIYDLRSRNLTQTMSPAIDILISSNLERWLYILYGPGRVVELYKHLSEEKYFELEQKELDVLHSSGLMAGWCSEEECCKVIQQKYEGYGYILDPHTAVAVAVAERFRDEKFGGENSDGEKFCYERNDGGKFCDGKIDGEKFCDDRSDGKKLGDGKSDGEKFGNEKSDGEKFGYKRPVLILATAHYSKFWDNVKGLVREEAVETSDPGPHEGIRDCLEKEDIHTVVIEPDLDILMDVVTDFVSDYFG